MLVEVVGVVDVPAPPAAARRQERSVSQFTVLTTGGAVILCFFCYTRFEFPYRTFKSSLSPLDKYRLDAAFSTQNGLLASRISGTMQ